MKTVSRQSLARSVREAAAEIAFLRPHPDHLSNADETTQRNSANELSYIGNYSKGLKHNDLGEVDPRAYRALLRALTSGNPDDFEKIPLGTPAPMRPTDPKPLKFTNPQAGLAFDLEGADCQALALPPAPSIDSAEEASEMAELYWMALLRDVKFTQPVEKVLAELTKECMRLIVQSFLWEGK